MGSFMAHLNCLPPRAAGVNYWFFLLAHLVVGVGIKQIAKFKMLLRKIYSEINVQIMHFPWNCEMQMLATCSTTDGNGSYHGFVLSLFKEMTRCRHQKHCRRRPDNPNGPSKFHKYGVFCFYVCLRLRNCDCCSVADGSGSCHAPAPSYFEEMTRCRRQKLHWRWPIEIPQFRFVYVYMIATNALAASLRLMAASGDRSNGM